MTDQAHTPHDDEEPRLMSIRYQGDDLKQCKIQVEEEDMDGLPVDLGLHLVARHADPAAADREEGDNETHHHQEHAGPGTIRDHDEGDLSYDRERVWAVLREADDAEEVYDRLMRETMAELAARAGQRAVFIADLKATPADGIGMIEEEPEIFFGSRPVTGKSVMPELALLGRATLDPAWQLAMHLAGVHADATAIDTDPEDNMAFHHEEHEGGHDHPEDDLSYDPARAVEILAQHQEDTREEDDKSMSEETFLALHLASAHHDDQAFFRTMEQNLAAHKAIPALMHQHTDVQQRYELVLAQKIEADLADGTVLPWCPVPHPPHDVTDLARMIGDMHAQAPDMASDLIAVDLAWIKTAAWPWHRRLRAAALIAFPLAWPPSWYIDKRVRKFARK